jgi:hypothetical protein
MNAVTNAGVMVKVNIVIREDVYLVKQIKIVLFWGRTVIRQLDNV